MGRARNIADALGTRKLEVLQHLFPNGKVIGNEFCVGSLAGEEGESLKIHLGEQKGPVWRDFATVESGGDLLDLWAKAKCGGRLKNAMEEAAGWLGLDDGQDRSRCGSRSSRASHASEEDRERPNGSAQPTARYVYTHKDGTPWIEVQRYERGGGKKDFYPYDLKAKRYFSEKKGHPLPTPRPIYKREEIVRRAGEPVMLVEGEKCVEAAMGIGVLTTTTLGGAQAIHKADLGPLAGRRVVLWPDNDTAGRDFIERGATLLEPLGCTLSDVQIPEGKPEGWDIADAVVDGMTPREIKTLIDSARVRNPPPLDVFGDTTLAGAPEIPLDALPNVIGDFARDEGERIGVDPRLSRWRASQWPRAPFITTSRSSRRCTTIAGGRARGFG